MLSDICSNSFSEIIPIRNISDGLLCIVGQNRNGILHGNDAVFINIASLNLLKLDIRFRL